MVAPVKVRGLSLDDAAATLSLYRAVAGSPRSGLARQPDELSFDYIFGNIAAALKGGVVLGAFADRRMVGVIRAMPMGPR